MNPNHEKTRASDPEGAPFVTPAERAAALAHYRENHQRIFRHRRLVAIGFSASLISVSLIIGVLGYHLIAGFDWVDSILNASMILSGMGPVGNLNNSASKLFAAAYALFSGVVFIGATGILLSPVFHRVLHQFHLDEKDMK